MRDCFGDFFIALCSSKVGIVESQKLIKRNSIVNAVVKKDFELTLVCTCALESSSLSCSSSRLVVGFRVDCKEELF